MARFIVAASCLAVLFGSSCGPTVPVPDAGRVTGGGLAGTGGGSSGGGSSGGGSATGGGTAIGDGGLSCLQITQPVTWNGGAGSGSYELQNDGGVGVHFTGVVFGPGAGPFTSLDLQLYNETPATPLALPLTGTFEAINNTFTVYPASLLSQNCTMTGTNCQQVFISTRGTYNVTAATQVVDAGTYVGTLSNVRYRQVNPMTFAAVPDGGCVDVTSFVFNTRWP